MNDQKLTYKQTSDETGIPMGTLYTLVFQKRIPHIRLGKRLVRFSSKEIAAWLKAHQVKAGV